ncbi:MAG: cyclase family protein [Candidatus Tectomicrobia bacterium]|uniref:Cyclase family protein n=1 Tax=Tectimicrobiota bacterium TaxID=2528274 RepID=A0A937W8J7_UNCTE|nr:cyclase family protein [Candidatus Tectomicrobia bacterium]
MAGHAGNGEEICGDLGQQGTQMDALGHFGFINQPGESPTYFGGLTQNEVVGPTGLLRLGIDKAEPIITSVVLLDAASYVNNSQALAPGYAITPQDIEEDILAAQGLAQRGIKAGDAVFIHTGSGAAWVHSPATYYTQGRLSYDAAVYLAAKKIVLVGLDNPCTDAVVHIPGVGPFPALPSWEHGNNPWLPFGVHHYTLTQAGVHQM